MSEVTVTMPMATYERMQAEIEKLSKQSVHNYIKREYSDFKKNEYETQLNVSAMQQDFGPHLIIK